MKKKVVILGCENSHANIFINYTKQNEEFSHVEVVGVYSDEPETAQKLQEDLGVPALKSYEELVGQVDGVIITARHGDRHYEYAKPYLAAGVPLFLDKPLMINEKDAAELKSFLQQNNIKATGGSCLRFAPTVQEVKQAQAEQTAGRTVSGLVRAPLQTDPQYGGFYYYAQHMVEMVMEVFGRHPNSVQVSVDKQGAQTVVFHYDDFNVVGLYTEEGSAEYYAARFSVSGCQGGQVPLTQLGTCFYQEFKDFVDLLDGGEMQESYEELFALVFVMNAIERAATSGKIEPILYA